MKLFADGMGGDQKTSIVIGTDNPLIQTFTKYLKPDYFQSKPIPASQPSK